MIDLDKLEALAKAATSGKWLVYKDQAFSKAKPNLGVVAAEWKDDSGNMKPVTPSGWYDGEPAPDLEYIAALSPDVVLELIGELRRLRKKDAKLHHYYEFYLSGDDPIINTVELRGILKNDL